MTADPCNSHTLRGSSRLSAAAVADLACALALNTRPSCRRRHGPVCVCVCVCVCVYVFSGAWDQTLPGLQFDIRVRRRPDNLSLASY